MKQILIIDDNASFLAALQEVLPRRGISVLAAKNAEEGLRLAEAHKPNLIVCDIMMPVMNGIALLQSVKANPELAHIPVVMMTVLENMNMIEEATKLGCAGYLEKHRSDLKDLAEKILNFLP